MDAEIPIRSLKGGLYFKHKKAPLKSGALIPDQVDPEFVLLWLNVYCAEAFLTLLCIKSHLLTFNQGFKT